MVEGLELARNFFIQSGIGDGMRKGKQKKSLYCTHRGTILSFTVAQSQ